MALTGINYFTGGLFSTSTGNAISYFTEGLFWEPEAALTSGIVEIFVDGMFTDDASMSAPRIFTFGVFSGALTPSGGGPELIWAHIMGQKRIQNQFIPI